MPWYKSLLFATWPSQNTAHSPTRFRLSMSPKWWHRWASTAQLVVVVLLILLHSGVIFLTFGYLASGALGVAVYSVILFRVLRKQGLFQHFNLRDINVPAREIFAFTIPLLTTDLLYVVMNSMDAGLLGHYGGASDVAAFRN